MEQQQGSKLEDHHEAFREVQSKKIKKELEEWIRSSNSVNILVTGKMGAGKSTLVNALVGHEVAEEGETLDSQTAKVTYYEETVNGIQVKVWDSPGLQDGTETDREAGYIEDMGKKCIDIDLCVFCINISTSRFTRQSKEVKAMVKLKDVFGGSLWDHVVIALTFANELVMRNDEMELAKRKNDKEELSRLFKRRIARWEEKIRAILTDVVKLPLCCVQGLTIIPTGFRKPSSLPDRHHWLSTFWFSSLHSMHKKAQPAMVKMNINRLAESPECIDGEEEDKVLAEQVILFSERGFEVGCEVGSPELGGGVGIEMAGEYYGLRERILLEQYMIAASVQQSKTQKESQECIATGLETT